MFRQQEWDIIKLQMKGIRINPFIFYKSFTGKQNTCSDQSSLERSLVKILFKITLVTISQLYHTLLRKSISCLLFKMILEPQSQLQFLGAVQTHHHNLGFVQCPQLLMTHLTH